MSYTGWEIRELENLEIRD